MRTAIIVLLGTAVLGQFLAPITAYAQTTAQEQWEQIQQNRSSLQADLEKQKAEREALRTQSIETRCNTVTTRINTYTTRYNEGRLRYVNRYNKLVEKLENLISKLNANNKNSLDLATEISVLKTMVSDFNSKVDTTINAFEETKTLACGESEGAYKTELNEARTLANTARAKAVEINGYFLTTISATLNEIRTVNK